MREPWPLTPTDSNSDGSVVWPNAFTHQFIHQDSFLILWCPVSGVCHLKRPDKKGTAQLKGSPQSQLLFMNWLCPRRAQHKKTSPPSLIYNLKPSDNIKFQLHVFLVGSRLFQTITLFFLSFIQTESHWTEARLRPFSLICLQAEDKNIPD